jgi:aromatic-L-amino-acid/L-tryptophan decarboxylase
MNEIDKPTTGPTALPLEMSATERHQLLDVAGALLDQLRERVDTSPIFSASPPELFERITEPPREGGAPPAEVFDRLRVAASVGWNKAHGGSLAFIPNGGLFSGAVAALLSAGINPFTGAAFEAPALVALEESVLRWLAGLFGLPPATEGVLLSGGSIANQTAVACARHQGFDAARSRAYLSERAHHSLHKALHLSGIPEHCVVSVPSVGGQRIDIEALSSQVQFDVASGLHPWMIVGVAGSTDTGAIDDLKALAALCRQHGAWFHVDAAYGGMFVLTERGASRLQGIDLADSITVDPHKGLMLPYGVGALLVSRPGVLAKSHAGAGNYMRDVPQIPGLPHYFERGPELTRPFRGLLVWLPLQLHGVGAFRVVLNRSLDLAVEAAHRLRSIPGIVVLVEPELSITAFRAVRGDLMTERILAAINQSGKFQVSSTTLGGCTYIRLAFLHLSTTSEAIAELVAITVGVVGTS